MFNVHTVKQLVITFVKLLIGCSGESDDVTVAGASDVEDGVRLVCSFVVHGVVATVDGDEQLIGTTSDGDASAAAGDDEMLLFTSAGSSGLQAGGVDGSEGGLGGED